MSYVKWIGVALYAAVALVMLGLLVAWDVEEKRTANTRLVTLDLALSAFWPATLLFSWGVALADAMRGKP